MRLFIAIELPQPVKDHLASIQRQLEPHLDRASMTRDHALHVTLTRARPVLPPATRKLVSDLTAPVWPGPTLTAERFILFQSRLTPQGSQYTKLHEFPLA